MAREKAIKNTAPTKTTVSIANQSMGPILFPRKSSAGVFAPPLVLPPGLVTEVDGEVWAQHKENNANIQNYIDRGIIAEVGKNTKQVVTTEASTVDLIVPEHLAGDDFQGEMAGARVLTPGTGTMAL